MVIEAPLDTLGLVDRNGSAPMAVAAERAGD
jgi:hypothetical protein